MSEWDWTVRGWQHADLAASWLLGALAYVAVIATLSFAVWKATGRLARWIAHKVRARRIRREDRRFGRTPGADTATGY